MVARLIDWRLAPEVTYSVLDVDPQLLADGRAWLTAWAREAGLQVGSGDDGSLRLQRAGLDWTVRFVEGELAAFVERPFTAPAFDLLIANAFLDLVDVPRLLPNLFAQMKPAGLYWFTINFDGETIFEPAHPHDEQFMRVYHRSMDDRRPGASRTGRQLFGWLNGAGAGVLAAGSSDWVVHADAQGRYPASEGRFVEHILDTVEQELRKHAEIDPAQLAEWVSLRREQLARGKLVYLAHQLDFTGAAAR